MTESEKTVVPVATFAPVEHSMSIDPHLEREKEQDPRRNRKNRNLHPTVQEQLDEEQPLRSENENSGHVDYHA